MSEHGFVYVVVRNDLSNAQKAVQSAHACIEVARNYIGKEDEHPSVIIVVVKNEGKLNKVIDSIGDKFDIQIFREPDIGNQKTAIATRPLYGEEREFFKRYQLMR